MVYHIEDDKIYLTAIKETLESTYGAVTPLHRPEDFQALRDQAIEDHVDQVLREMRDDNGETRHSHHRQLRPAL